MTEQQKLHRDRRDADIIAGAVLIITALDDYEATYAQTCRRAAFASFLPVSPPPVFSPAAACGPLPVDRAGPPPC